MTRTFRPQFTLRLLLLAMALFAIALGVWRWPWVEEVAAYDTQRVKPPGYDEDSRVAWNTPVKSIATARIPFHRGWNGAPLKHGLLEAFYSDGRLMLQQPWRDGLLHGLERWYDSRGINIEQTWNNGERDGPFRYRIGKDWVGEGKFINGVAHFKRREKESWASGAEIWKTTTWIGEQRHGPARWETAAGEVLQAGEYDGDQLVSWNGEPVIDYLEDWIATGKINDPIEIQRLRGRGVSPVMVDYSQWPFRNSQARGFNEAFMQWGSKPAEFISNSLPLGLAPDWRYGQFWLVPLDEIGFWKDPTGVSDLDVSQLPKLAAVWNRPHSIDGYLNLPFEQLYAYWPADTETDLDFATHLPEEDQRLKTNFVRLKPNARFAIGSQDFPSLKHWLGLRLYQAGLQCELQGNKIVILPHWTKRRIMSATHTSD